MDIQLRIANRDDLSWVNDKYRELQFMPSVYENEFIAIAESMNQLVGVGRLISVAPDVFELGGIYVVDRYREMGFAKKIADFLLRRLKPFHIVYCIPFAHLLNFYQKLGFSPCDDQDQIPDEIRQRHKVCLDTYKHDVLLLKLCKNMYQPSEDDRKSDENLQVEHFVFP